MNGGAHIAPHFTPTIIVYAYMSYDSLDSEFITLYLIREVHV